MTDFRHIGAAACFFLVALRMAIGWQFLYEGLWKLDTQDTARPWTAAGYLKNAQGPFRDYFRNLTGDPDDLKWLDYDAVAARWDAWHARFVRHHPDLSPQQKARLEQMVNGAARYAVPLAALPEGVAIPAGLKRVVQFDPKARRLIVDGRLHLIPRERDELLKLADRTEHPEFHQAVNRLYEVQANLSYKERAAALLKGDPERAGLILKEKDQVIERRKGDIQLYRDMVARYERDLQSARQAFQHEHLNAQRDDLQKLRARLVEPIKALDAELQSEARKLLTPAQWARGPVPPLRDRQWQIDQLTMWSLTVLGVLLLVGCASRLAALGAAGMLVSFYLAMPPWPGVVEFRELPGPEHSYIVDKNLIEVVALLAIAALPTGSWFGLDRLFSWWNARRRALRRAGVIPSTPSKHEKLTAALSAAVAGAAGEQKPKASKSTTGAT